MQGGRIYMDTKLKRLIQFWRPASESTVKKHPEWYYKVKLKSGIRKGEEVWRLDPTKKTAGKKASPAKIGRTVGKKDRVKRKRRTKAELIEAIKANPKLADKFKSIKSEVAKLREQGVLPAKQEKKTKIKEAVGEVKENKKKTEVPEIDEDKKKLEEMLQGREELVKEIKEEFAKLRESGILPPEQEKTQGEEKEEIKIRIGGKYGEDLTQSEINLSNYILEDMDKITSKKHLSSIVSLPELYKTINKKHHITKDQFKGIILKLDGTAAISVHAINYGEEITDPGLAIKSSLGEIFYVSASKGDEYNEIKNKATRDKINTHKIKNLEQKEQKGGHLSLGEWENSYVDTKKTRIKKKRSN